MEIVSHKTQSFHFLSILLSKPSQSNTRQSVQANTITTRSESCYKRSGVHAPSNVRVFKRFPTHGNQYQLIHLRLETKMATSVLECILRAMFVNSNVLQLRSRPRVRRQGVFALTFMANIQRTLYYRPCSLYTIHLTYSFSNGHVTIRSLHPQAILFLPASSKALNSSTETPIIRSVTSAKAVTHILRSSCPSRIRKR